MFYVNFKYLYIYCHNYTAVTNVLSHKYKVSQIHKSRQLSLFTIPDFVFHYCGANHHCTY